MSLYSVELRSRFCRGRRGGFGRLFNVIRHFPFPFLKEDGQFIGWTGIKFINDHIENGNTNFYDYGYRLEERFWNKGYATEATKFWLEYGFNQMQIQEMNAYTHAQNGASNHILSKCGMQFLEEYTAEDGINWKWWQLFNPNQK